MGIATWYQCMNVYLTAVAIVGGRLSAGTLMLHMNTMGRVLEALYTKKGIQHNKIFLVRFVRAPPYVCACV
jgi:hypothetical protein